MLKRNINNLRTRIYQNKISPKRVSVISEPGLFIINTILFIDAVALLLHRCARLLAPLERQRQLSLMFERMLVHLQK